MPHYQMLTYLWDSIFRTGQRLEKSLWILFGTYGQIALPAFCMHVFFMSYLERV